MVSRSVRRLLSRLRKLYPVILQLRHGGEIHLPEARLDAHEPPARPAPSARPRRLSPCGRPEGTEGGSPSAPPPPAGVDPPQLPPTPAPLTTAAAPRLRRETRRSRNPNTGARRPLWLLTNAPHSPPPVRRRLPSPARTADCLRACAHCPARPEAWAGPRPRPRSNQQNRDVGGVAGYAHAYAAHSGASGRRLGPASVAGPPRAGGRRRTQQVLQMEAIKGT